MTARQWYAVNARDLLESRRNGYRPETHVVVSMIGGEFPEAANTLYVREGMPLDRMDWRMVVDTTVHIWASRYVPLARVQQAIDGIARSRPAMLFLRFGNPDGAHHDVEVGEGFHFDGVLDVPAEHRFTWCPTNNCGSSVGAKLRRALLAQHPAFTVL